MRKLTILLLLLLSFWGTNLLRAQVKKHWGTVKGAIESNMALYYKDPLQSKTNRFGTNTFVSLGYDYKKFSAGVQYDLFTPPLRGFDPELKGQFLSQYFAQYATGKLQVRLGTFFEQYGSGLILRSYEERSLGLNNTLRGAKVYYAPTEWLQVKAMVGQPRRYLAYADSWLWGGDATLSLSKLLLPKASWELSYGASWVGKQNIGEAKTDPTSIFQPQVIPDAKTVQLVSQRLDFAYNTFSIGVEYVGKGASQTFDDKNIAYKPLPGYAWLLTMDYTAGDFGFSMQSRRIEHMDFRMDHYQKTPYLVMNYLPALTKQHRYTLPALYPHAAAVQDELGGEIDLFYQWRAPFLGKYPIKFALNASAFRALKEGYPAITKDDKGNETVPNADYKPLFQELSLEVSKRFTHRFEATFGGYLQNQYKYGLSHVSKALVVDTQWRPTRRYSIRTEAQYMHTEQQEGQWLFGLVELGFAPYLTLFASDLVSLPENDKANHYYNFGAAFRYHSLLLQASYGRTRAGVQCVGGICRNIPASQGANLLLAYTF